MNRNEMFENVPIEMSSELILAARNLGVVCFSARIWF